MYLAIQNVHAPYSLPPAWQTRNLSADADENVYLNMVALLDDAVGNTTAALQDHGLWGDALVLFSADNGGVGSYGNNYPRLTA